MINCGGEKVFPAEVEDAIRLFDNIEDCVVFGERSPLIGQMVCAKISVKDKSIDENEYKSKLNSHLNSVLDKYKIPMKVSIVASIGMTDRGKKDRSIC
jgi:acyl-coenzyme A synthetase/AMP-(fatty) acid ligase